MKSHLISNWLVHRRWPARSAPRTSRRNRAPEKGRQLFHSGGKAMSTFIKDFIEKATIDRRRFLLASAAGVGGVMASGVLGAGRVLAADQPAIAWSYRDRSSPYWNYIVSGGESFVESLGRNKSDLINLINNGSSE